MPFVGLLNVSRLDSAEITGISVLSDPQWSRPINAVAGTLLHAWELRNKFDAAYEVHLLPCDDQSKGSMAMV
jgi:hypothetical protein